MKNNKGDLTKKCDCKKPITEGSSYVCKKCNKEVCNSCYVQNHNKCPNCNSQMMRLGGVEHKELLKKKAS